MEPVEERFLRYVKINTQSKAGCDEIPSTPFQWDLAHLLVEELHALGVADARVDEHCYVMGSIPSNLPDPDAAPALGLIAHMDTATETSGENVNPRIVRNYDGSPIVLNEELGMVLDPATFQGLAKHIGEDLIVTDGTTLLGADNKAGVAEIMALVERLHENPAIPHGKLCIGFTPDEEVGRGADMFDIEAFGADPAYTVDGGELGELEYENFNAASVHISIRGHVVHPGSSKGRMKNAALIATRLQALLPAAEDPAHTEGREGFYHLHSMSGDVARAEMEYLIRDHDNERFERRKRFMEQAVALLNVEYGESLVETSIEDACYNMKEKILLHMELIDLAREAMEETGIEPFARENRADTRQRGGVRLSACRAGHVVPRVASHVRSDRAGRMPALPLAWPRHRRRAFAHEPPRRGGRRRRRVELRAVRRNRARREALRTRHARREGKPLLPDAGRRGADRRRIHA